MHAFRESEARLREYRANRGEAVAAAPQAVASCFDAGANAREIGSRCRSGVTLSSESVATSIHIVTAWADFAPESVGVVTVGIGFAATEGGVITVVMCVATSWTVFAPLLREVVTGRVDFGSTLTDFATDCLGSPSRPVTAGAGKSTSSRRQLTLRQSGEMWAGGDGKPVFGVESLHGFDSVWHGSGGCCRDSRWFRHGSS